MKYRLTNSDIAFIAELRAEGCQWKYIAQIYNIHWNILAGIFNYRMKVGFIYG